MRRQFLTTALMGAVLLAGIAAPARADEPIKVVYQLSDGLDQASRALGNIRNHLRAAPDTRIVVVGLGDGIKFLLKDATERNGNPFEPAVMALAKQGVEFRVCANTLSAHDVSPERVIASARLVPSGVAEIARLQAREGFVYLRP
ncbi:DsrE family protein [Actimicrobium antarcticum]|uniref:DsrE family protein n=1 Tax=Actimicrobium antarcticum TaxID=1051899 RepID=A0ABP7T6I8_9BURK